jgi:hypothetical protein
VFPVDGVVPLEAPSTQLASCANPALDAVMNGIVIFLDFQTFRFYSSSSCSSSSTSSSSYSSFSSPSVSSSSSSLFISIKQSFFILITSVAILFSTCFSFVFIISSLQEWTRVSFLYILLLSHCVVASGLDTCVFFIHFVSFSLFRCFRNGRLRLL